MKPADEMEQQFAAGLREGQSSSSRTTKSQHPVLERRAVPRRTMVAALVKKAWQ